MQTKHRYPINPSGTRAFSMASTSGSRLLRNPLVGPSPKFTRNTLKRSLKSMSRVLPRMLPIMAHFSARLSRTRVSESLVYIFRRRAHQGLLRSSLHRLLRVASLNVRVQPLLSGVVDGVWLEGAAGRRSAGRVGSMENSGLLSYGEAFTPGACWGLLVTQENILLNQTRTLSWCRGP
jgi:hypothetical protein